VLSAHAPSRIPEPQYSAECAMDSLTSSKWVKRFACSASPSRLKFPCKCCPATSGYTSAHAQINCYNFPVPVSAPQYSRIQIIWTAPCQFQSPSTAESRLSGLLRASFSPQVQLNPDYLDCPVPVSAPQVQLNPDNLVYGFPGGCSYKFDS
jgi:hypothetical protein